MPKPGTALTKQTPSLVPDLSLQENDLWKRTKATLSWEDHIPDKNVEVLVYGPMIIYQHNTLPGVEKARNYALRWNRGSRIILRLDKLSDLMKVAEELFDSFPMVWKQQLAEEIVATLPTWVRDWVIACSDDNCYYDPTPLKG